MEVGVTSKPSIDDVMKTLLLTGSALILVAQLWAATPERPKSELIVELLVSRDQDNRNQGGKLLADARQEIVTGLVSELSNPDPKVVEAAAFELGILFSPWAQGRDASRRFIQFTDIYDSRRPVERPSLAAEAPVIRDALMQSFMRLREQAEAKPDKFFNFEEALRCVASSLNEFADDHVVDWAIEELSKIKSPYLAESLFRLAEQYIGCPQVFRADAICGNSTEAEVKLFMQEQANTLARSIMELKTKWAFLKPQAIEERIKIAITAWRDKIVPIMRQSSGSYHHEGWLSEDFSPLIRFGQAALPQLRKQRDSESDLGERAVWDYFIASISGETDDQMIRQLMMGSDPQREMACEIIAVSGQAKWATDLEQLKMVNGYHLAKASQTLAACLFNQAIPSLERLHSAFPKEYHTEYALLELRARMQKGEPRRRIGYRKP